MSLNGLDAPEIAQAHQETLAEPGGWFLLRYVSRDEVDLLARGSGGLAEVSIALAAYPDASPLYGFLNYRRRKVLLKYTPPDTSRLLQARSGVHFELFADNFAHDAEFTANAPHEVCDATLASVCVPHAARSTSLHSMASSIKRPNLDEIFEDAEESPRLPEPSASESKSTPPLADPPPAQSVDQDSELIPSSLHTAQEPPTLPADDGFNIPAYPRDHSPQRSIDEYYYKSSVTETRPTTSESWKYDLDTWKPKEKARPRPVADDKFKKSTSSGASRSALPAGMRLSAKRTEDRPRSSRGHREARRMNGDADTPPLPSVGNGSLPSPLQSPAVEGSAEHSSVQPTVVSPTSSTVEQRLPETSSSLALDGASDDAYSPSSRQAANATEQTSAGAKSKPAEVSLDKQRLMKALQMRKRQKELAKEASEAETASIAAAATTAPTSPVDFVEAQTQLDSAEKTAEVPSNNQKDEHTVMTEHIAPADSQQALEPASAHKAPTAIDIPDASITSPPATSDSAVPITPEPKPEGEGTLFVKKRPELQSAQTGGTHSSEGGFHSDDSLLDELQSAKLQDATSVEVAQAPASPPNAVGATRQPAVTPVDIKRSPPPPARPTVSPGVTRNGRVSSMSQTSQETLGLSKNRNVSSGISKRIQALADNSSRETSPAGQSRVESGPEVARSFLTIRNLASRPSSRDGGPVKGSQASRASSPGRSVAARSLRFFKTSSSSKEDRAKTSHGAPTTSSAGESTMTARIVQSADGPGSNRLTQTPVVVEQSKPRAPATPATTDRPGSSAASISSRHSARTMLSRHTVENGWNFIKRSGRKSESSMSPPTTARSMSSTSLERVDENDKDDADGPEEKRKSSRASRLLKRMSGLSSRSNKADKDSDQKSSRNSTSKDKKNASSTPVGFSLGDINVQFPDTLLWKRRWVEVDSMGNLVLGAAAGERTRGEKKRFHLRDFRPALAPSQERQELPHSIMLDFHHGGTLQLAFEDPIGQTTILRKLLDTQSGWTSMHS